MPLQENLQSQHSFADRLKLSLQYAKNQTVRLQKTHVFFLISSIVCSSATTLVAAITAAQGPIIGDGPAGWKISCMIAAVFGFVATLAIGLNQQLKVSERLSRSYQCLGRLQSLDVATAVGSREIKEIIQEYEEVVRTYPEYVG